jgi:hypothetical protein
MVDRTWKVRRELEEAAVNTAKEECPEGRRRVRAQRTWNATFVPQYGG